MAVVAAVTLAGGCSPGVVEKEATPILTPDQALDVARTYYQAFSDAWVSHRPDQIDGVLTGAAAELTANGLARSLAQGNQSGSAQPEPVAIEVFVTRQAAYPAFFLAQYSYAPEQGRQPRLAVLTNDGTSTQGTAGGWKMAALVDDLDGTATRRVRVTPDGYAFRSPGIGPLAAAFDPEYVDAALANYLNGYRNAAEPASPLFGEGTETTEAVTAFRDYRDASADTDVNWTIRHTTSGFPTYSWQTVDGGALAVFSLRQRQALAPVGGGPLVIDGSGGGLAAGIPGGTYASLAFERLVIHAVAVPPPGAEETTVRFVAKAVDRGRTLPT